MRSSAGRVVNVIALEEVRWAVTVVMMVVMDGRRRRVVAMMPFGIARTILLLLRVRWLCIYLKKTCVHRLRLII